MKTESDLSKHIKQKLNPAWYDVHDLQLAGVLSLPDLYINSLSTGGFFLELKRVLKSKDAIEFRPGQTTWIVNHIRRGGRAAVAVLEVPAKKVWVFRGCEAKRLAGTSLEEAKGLCSPWDLTLHWETPDHMFLRTILSTQA